MIIPSDSANSDVIRIEGDPKGVKAAKQQLLEIASKMVTTLCLSVSLSVHVNLLYVFRFIYIFLVIQKLCIQ